MDRSFLTDNPKLVDEIVCEVKSQGVFDQFRRNCIADVDTKPAYQNLRQRVENIVSNFLNEQVWRPDLNKNQLREKLRKHITEAGFLETGVERIVDQVVNPKINSVFLPKIEDISYKYLGIEKPKPSDDQTLQSELCSNEDIKPKILPTDLDDLEAVSPDSTGSKKSFKDSTEDLNTPVDLIKTELNDSVEKVDDDFESPAFEPLKGSLLTGSDSINGEEDSKLSDISGLTSQDSVNSEQDSEQQPSEQQVEPEIKAPTIEVIEQPAVTQSQQVIPENINQDSVLSQVSSNSHLSIVTDSNNKSSEVDICEEAQMPKFSENSFNNPDDDEKERKPLLTSFDIKQDEIKFEGTERRSSLHDLNEDIKLEEDVVMEELKDSVRTESVGEESLIKTESSSSCMDPIISETKDLSLKDDCRSNENEFKFEEPAVSVDTTDVSVGGSNQNPNDKHKSKDLKGERKSDSKSEHKSHRRDKDKASHHSRDKHKDGDRKHSSSSSSKHSSSSSSGRKEHRSESRETKKSTSSDHRRDESSKSIDRSSVKTPSSSHSSSRDKDSNHKSSRSHDDKHDKSFKDPTDKDKNRSRHDRSSNKSRTQHRDEKTKRRSHDDDKKKLEPESKSKTMDDDHGPHHEKTVERRRSTDRDSDDGSGERGSGKPSSTNQQTEVGSVNSAAITNSTSSSSFSSTASSCTDEHEKRETTNIQKNAADSNVHTSSTDSDDNFVPTSAPVVVDQILIGNDINLEMLMETNNMLPGEMDPVMASMLQQSLSDDSEMKIKKPKVASNIFEARKLMKVRKQMERDKKKRLEKLLVHTKQMVGSNTVDEQGVELEFSMMNSSAPSISSPIKPKEVLFDGLQAAAPINEKRNSGEFIIDMKEMEKQLKKKKPEKPIAAKFAHKFDEILSQIDKPRKRDSNSSTSPISPIYERSPKGLHEKSPKFEPMQRKYVREQSKECTVVDSKKPTITSPPLHPRDDKKIEKSAGRSQDGSKPRKDSSSSKSPPTSHSPVKIEQKIGKSNKTLEKTTKLSNAAGSASTSAKHEKLSSPSKQTVSVKQSKVDLADPPKDITPTTAPKHEDISKVRAEKSIKSNADSDEENSNGFCGFPAKKSFYEAVLDYPKVQQILEAKLNDQTLHLMNCDKSMCDIFSHHSTNVFDVSGNEQCLISEKFTEPVDKSVAGPNTKDPRKSLSSKNGVRTTTQQHKLFIENNQFADKSEVKQISRKRGASGGVQGTAAKIVRLVDSKISGDEIEGEETSPTPSEQSKENQSIHQVKKHNRTTDNTCTSNELDQQSGEKSESNKLNQRYASEDLYKPRPILSRTRRRGIENGDI